MATTKSKATTGDRLYFAALIQWAVFTVAVVLLPGPQSQGHAGSIPPLRTESEALSKALTRAFFSETKTGSLIAKELVRSKGNVSLDHLTTEDLSAVDRKVFSEFENEFEIARKNYSHLEQTGLIQLSARAFNQLQTLSRAFHPSLTRNHFSRWNTFGEKYVRSFEFIDLSDLLVMITKGKAEPWTRYDTDNLGSLLNRWVLATDPNLTLNDHPLNLFQIFSQNPRGQYRSHPIPAGGDIFVDGIGYYRVNQRQLSALKSNPYLVVESINDPSAGLSTETTFLARHHYPSVETFHRFEQKLSRPLAQELQTFESTRNFHDKESNDYKRLNRLILSELIEAALGGNPTLEYQRLISIHPFSDFNGRSMRVHFQKRTGAPLFLRNFDDDLFLGPTEFMAKVENGIFEWKTIITALEKEMTRNPGFPDFYRVPEPWLIAADLDPGKIENGDELMYRMFDFFKEPDIRELVRQKRDLEFSNRLRSYLAPFIKYRTKMPG